MKNADTSEEPCNRNRPGEESSVITQLRLRHLRLKLLLAATLTGALFSDGCFDSSFADQFRTALAPGLTKGLSSAITDPTNAEAGLRQAAAAFIQGFGAIISPAQGSSSGSGSHGGGSSGGV